MRDFVELIHFIFMFSEGLKERDKTAIGTLLKTVSYMRENTYHLHRHLWNDVHEDWPFYSEQERQTLKRYANPTTVFCICFFFVLFGHCIISNVNQL